MVATGVKGWQLGTREVAGKGPPPGPPKRRFAEASGGTFGRCEYDTLPKRQETQFVSDYCPLERNDDST
jgi:hypothetical protein